VTILEQVYASGGDIIISTLELTCPAWVEPIRICNGFEDQTVTLETAASATFVAAGIDVSLPEKSNRGGASLSFAIDNVLGEAQSLLDQAFEEGEQVLLTYRAYLASDLSEPAEAPLKLIVRGGTMQGSTIQIQAAFFDLINTKWPRNDYTAGFAPGLKYI
jgi:hypothetical protein